MILDRIVACQNDVIRHLVDQQQPRGWHGASEKRMELQHQSSPVFGTGSSFRRTSNSQMYPNVSAAVYHDFGCIQRVCGLMLKILHCSGP